jgi:hypothetical protein
LRQFIADKWPARLWMAVVPFAVPALVAWIVDPLPWVLGHWLNAASFVGLLILAWAVGWFAAIIPGWLLLGPLYYAQGLSNGAPYRAGDHVRVLSRRQRGRVARVYEVWAERNEVRLELGEAARQRVQDVFSYFQVNRAQPAEQAAPADRPHD